MIRFGAPVFFGHGDPEQYAKAHKAKGYTAAYAPPVTINDTQRIAQYRKVFERENILFAEVGYWDNLVDTVSERRLHNRECMMNALALAEELGARCAVDIFGSYVHGAGSEKHSAENFSDDAFAEAVDMARYFIDTVKPKTACFSYEIFPFSLVDSPEMIEKLIKAVDRKMFGVHLDLCNLINSPRTYWNSGGIVRECVRLFGDRIIAAHVKDIKLREPAISVILEEVIAGTGNIDMHAFAREIHALPQEIPFMLEHLSSEAEYDMAVHYVRQCAEAEGILI